MAALPPDGVSAALGAVDGSGAYPTTKLAMRLLALAATRSGEVRGMRWDEIDADVWTIPGERTKVGRDFRVPLNPDALAMLDKAHRYSDGARHSLVLPSARGRQITAYWNDTNTGGGDRARTWSGVAMGESSS